MAARHLFVGTADALRAELIVLSDGDTVMVDRDHYEQITGEPWRMLSGAGKKIMIEIAMETNCDLLSFGPASDGVYFRKSA